MRKVTSSGSKKESSPMAAELANYREFIWYKKNEEDLLRRYFGRYIVIKDEKVMADYGSKTLAWQETIQKHQPGTFIIHHCVPVDVKRLPKLANRQFVTIHG